MKALANERRLEILNWLKDPIAHFPPQRGGELVKDSVRSLFIAETLGVNAPTASEHLRILTQVGLIRAKRIKVDVLQAQRAAHRQDQAVVSQGMVSRATVQVVPLLRDGSSLFI